MPELPEVEEAAQRLDAAIAGRILRAIELRHPAIDTAAARHARALIGQRVERVRRVAKWQELEFRDGHAIIVQFRMTGDWAFTRTSAPPAHARAHLLFSGGMHVWLTDPRVLGRIQVRVPGEPSPTPTVGPDAIDPTLTPDQLRARFASRRAPIKQVLLDQKVLAGLGNIYVAEALWYARIRPTRPAASLSPIRVAALLDGIRWTLGLAFAEFGRHSYGEAVDRLAVYDREGEACRRCGAQIRRMVQGQRSTYWCAGCQR
jgi:formamidopyrimidine-DNA glycosylase